MDKEILKTQLLIMGALLILLGPDDLEIKDSIRKNIDFITMRLKAVD